MHMHIQCTVWNPKMCSFPERTCDSFIVVEPALEASKGCHPGRRLRIVHQRGQSCRRPRIRSQFGPGSARLGVPVGPILHQERTHTTMLAYSCEQVQPHERQSYKAVSNVQVISNSLQPTGDRRSATGNKQPATSARKA